ncbi:MAG: hypothetical protein AAFV85_22865 [Cyanobacteria bacterium J06634_6]
MHLKNRSPQNKNAKHSKKECQYLDLEQSYPCPACKHGSLIPITLTEAWGCDRCKQLFERTSEPDTVTKLSSPYPHQKTWQWTGKHWVANQKAILNRWRDAAFRMRIVTVFVLLWMGWTLLAFAGISLSIRPLILLSLVVMFWVVLRR